MRIAILAHSTNPRGGVVHAMQLAEALCAAGEDATLIAPDVAGHGFFRQTACPVLLIPARPQTDVAAMVACRIEEIAGCLAAPGAPRFDLHHAQDPISANALADLAARHVIGGFVRTVHHLDRFDDPRLASWQARGMRAANVVGVVSRLWQRRLSQEHDIAATLLGNGVDTRRFSPVPDGREPALRARLGIAPHRRVVLTLGGIETRKNTPGTLRAFLRLRAEHPDLCLVVAGGATLLDHGPARRAFEAELSASGAGHNVILAGVIDDADMPALYRIAAVLACPSLEEGFGLCPLEAMACGCPAVVSAIAPFDEHLGPDEVVWTDPFDPAAIAAALSMALGPAAPHLRRLGPQAAARFGWNRVAAAHAPFYASGLAAMPTKEPIHA